MASISHSIACAIGGSKSKLEDHLLRFEPPVTIVVTPEESKAIWLAAAGIKI
jgi:hypothetical protein